MKGHDMVATEDIRVWIGCLASYNAGTLYGDWVDITDMDADDIRAEIARILKGSPEPNAEEWAFMDWDDPTGLFRNMGENPNIDDLAEALATFSEAGENGPAWAAYCDHIGDMVSLSDFEDAYRGEWDSERDYAETLFDDLHNVPDNLASYIDYEAFARDLFMGDCFSIDCPSGGVWVFWNQ